MHLSAPRMCRALHTRGCAPRAPRARQFCYCHAVAVAPPARRPCLSPPRLGGRGGVGVVGRRPRVGGRMDVQGGVAGGGRQLMVHLGGQRVEVVPGPRRARLFFFCLCVRNKRRNTKDVLLSFVFLLLCLSRLGCRIFIWTMAPSSMRCRRFVQRFESRLLIAREARLCARPALAALRATPRAPLRVHTHRYTYIFIYT